MSSHSAPSRRAIATADRKAQILAATLRCFEQMGYADTTVEDIRQASGASIGSIYHHFGSKDGAFAALYVHILSEYRTAIIAHLASVASARELVTSAVGYHLDWALERPVEARFVYATRRTAWVAKKEVELQASTRQFARRLLQKLRVYVKRGEVLELPSALYIPILMGPTQEVIRHWANGRLRGDLASYRPHLVESAWNAIRVPPEAAAAAKS